MVIVAGAAGALGHATTATLAASGLTVVAVDRNERGLRDLPGSVRPEVADTTDPAAVNSLIDRIADEVGPPDVLVNNIGAFRPGDALSTTPDTLQLMINVNLAPALWLSQAVAPHMRQQGSGVIVHVAARPGIEPSGGMAAYSASKAALVHLTRILDIELRPHGIRVNAVAPEAIAGVIAFLVSDAAVPVSGRYCPRTALKEADTARRTCRKFRGQRARESPGSGDHLSPDWRQAWICREGTHAVQDVPLF